MNWYIKTIYSQMDTGLTGYLQRLRAPSGVIQFITSQEEKLAQFLTNIFRKNPALTLNDLQNVQIPQKIDPYLPNEYNLAKDHPNMQKWILVNFRKLRQGRIFNSPSLTNWIRTTEEGQTYREFAAELAEIKDWVSTINPDLSSYSAQEAIEASQEWHRTIAGEGRGKIYQPTKPENIMYGPVWKKEEWYGWTIQKVISGNDLLVEGNKMNHCVGGYCNSVQTGKSIIYSLRDPQNNPHVTMETDGRNIEQIQGNSNSDPDSEYRAMIKEWITGKSSSDINKEIDPFTDLTDDIHYDLDDIKDAIKKIGTTNEYGLEYALKAPIENLANELVELNDQERNSRYQNVKGFSKLLVDISLEQKLDDDKFINLYSLEKELLQMNEEVWNDLDRNPYGTTQDYRPVWDANYTGTFEEYQKEIEEYEQEETDTNFEMIKDTTRGGFSYEGLDYIEELRKDGIIPSTEKLKNLHDFYTKKKKDGYKGIIE